MFCVKHLQLLNPLFKKLGSQLILQYGRAQCLVEVDIHQHRRARIIHHTVLARGGRNNLRYHHEAILLHLDDRLFHGCSALMLLDRPVARVNLDGHVRLTRRGCDVIGLDPSRFLHCLFPRKPRPIPAQLRIML